MSVGVLYTKENKNYMRKIYKKLLTMLLLASITVTTSTIQVKAKTWKTLGTFRLSYYCSERYPHICNAGYPYKTASGTTVTPGRTIAVDPRIIPLGSKVKIDKKVYIAEDTGGAIRGNRIDVCVSSHSEALRLGIQYKKVKVFR